MWLLDVLMALFGHREFINGVFGRYAAPNFTYKAFWGIALIAIFLIIWGSLYFKQQERNAAAMTVAAIPLVLALPYVLWLSVVLIAGRNTNWH